MPRALVAFIFGALLLSPAAAAARTPHAEPLPYVELVTGGASADAELPLIVALHGRGDTAEAFAEVFRDLPMRARVAILRPPRAWGDGQAWFLAARAHLENRPAIAAELVAPADRVAATVEVIRMPAIVAFHGDADPLVPVDEDRRRVTALEKRGVHADLRVYPGLGHTLSPALRTDLFAAMSRALAH